MTPHPHPLSVSPCECACEDVHTADRLREDSFILGSTLSLLPLLSLLSLLLLLIEDAISCLLIHFAYLLTYLLTYRGRARRLGEREAAALPLATARGIRV
eukprot:GHVU01230418.1.p2 GENE.GHVU01230418.1~~GHVU01230418.1.p2  ORF type:complete len:100 (-),score=1.07 GHVU01230418.1:192-491(-)